jgi:plastocyanin
MTRTLRTTAIAAIALTLSLGATACGGDDDPDSAKTGGEAPAAQSQPATGSVDIKTFMFQPDPVRVKAGTEVTWTNQDDILHTVTSGKRGKTTDEFDKKVNLNDEFSHTFDKPGTYPYVCTIHMGMDGTVVVS